jgi:hypothetical protein
VNALGDVHKFSFWFKLRSYISEVPKNTIVNTGPTLLFYLCGSLSRNYAALMRSGFSASRSSCELITLITARNRYGILPTWWGGICWGQGDIVKIPCIATVRLLRLILVAQGQCLSSAWTKRIQSAKELVTQIWTRQASGVIFSFSANLQYRTVGTVLGSPDGP